VEDIKPTENPIAWDNPYCDHIFLKYNQSISKDDSIRNKEERYIRPYRNPVDAASQGCIDPQEKEEREQPIIGSQHFLVNWSQF
jgi:hypothetical protein